MEILEAIKIACRQVDNRYFLLSVDPDNSTVKRERVYCYELYHQLRLVFHDSPLTLTGEPDKGGHSNFTGKQPIPDFILHTPGNHEDNTAVIEVECTPTKKHLTKDLETLKLMKEKGYRELILLLFAVHQVPWDKLIRAAEEAGICLGEIVVLIHRNAGEQATRECQPNSQ